MTVTAWHASPDLKTEAVERMRLHRAQDEFLQGTYVQRTNGSYRGCFHGCLTADALLAEKGLTVRDLDRIDPNWHREGERLFGIPEKLGYILDRMFERLPPEDCAEFAVSVTEAVPAGADLSQVVDRWVLDILADPEHGVWKYTKDGTDQRAAVEAVSGLYRRRLAGDEPARVDWDSARKAARRAAAAAYAYAYAAAAAAAADAAAAAAYAYAAAYAAADAAKRWQAARLIHHISEAPIAA